MPGGKSHSEPTRWAPADPALCFSVLLLASNLQQSGAIPALSRDQIGCRVVNNDQGPCLSNCCGGLRRAGNVLSSDNDREAVHRRV